MHHLTAYAESLDPAAALVNVAAINDDSIFTAGDDIRVPVALPYLMGSAALISATLPIQAQLQSPSLRQVANIDIEPCATGLVFGDPAELAIHPRNPIPLRGDESLNFLVNTNPAAPELHYGLVWFADGPQQPVNGEIFSVRTSVTLTAVANAWVNGSLAFGQDLPVGNYDIVGMRCRGAGGVGARLNFIGGAWRPGVPCSEAINQVVGDEFRYGRMGVFGTFHTNTPPSVEILAAAATTTFVITLDLIARG